MSGLLDRVAADFTDFPVPDEALVAAAMAWLAGAREEGREVRRQLEALVATGVFGTLIATGRVTLFPAPSPTATGAVTAEPVLDTAYKVTVLNATSQSGLAGAMADELVAAGWAADDVTAGEAGSEFATTTVFYSDVADEGAARGLAQAIGGAAVELSDAYTGLAGDESVKQLVVVIGTDRTDAGAATTAP